MTEEMITVLGRLSPGRLGVIARTSSMTFKNSNRTAAEIGRKLSVNYLLECSVREATNRLHINAQLIRTRDELHVWAQAHARRSAISSRRSVRIQTMRPLMPDSPIVTLFNCPITLVLCQTACTSKR